LNPSHSKHESDISKECGEQRWAEVPAGFARAVTQSARTYLIRCQLLAYPGSAQPPQAAHSKQLPSSTSMPSSKAAEGFAKGTQADDGSESPSRNPRLGANPNTNTSTASSPLTSQRVFFLVAAGSGFRLAQIRVEKLTTYEFFRELRQQYNDLRRFFRRWLSIWVYSHCDFYRVRNTSFITYLRISDIELTEIAIVRQIRSSPLRA